MLISFSLSLSLPLSQPDDQTSIDPFPVLVISNNLNQLQSSKKLENAEPLVSDPPICRICHCGETDTDTANNESSQKSLSRSHSVNPSNVSYISIPIPEMNLIAPCYCSGSLRYVHDYCLQQWIRSSNNKYCELCKYHFKMSVKYKPFHKVSHFWYIQLPFIH